MAPLPEGGRRRRGGRTLTSALRSGPRGPFVATLLVGALLSSACGGSSDAPERSRLSDSVYVEVMARLVLLDPDMTSETDVPLRGLPRDSARRRVLARWEVDPDLLLRFAEERGRSPARMADLWRRIQERSDTLESRGWRPTDDGETVDDQTGDSVPVDTATAESSP